jgi:hypothetical protein
MLKLNMKIVVVFLAIQKFKAAPHLSVIFTKVMFYNSPQHSKRDGRAKAKE